jgi:endoglucanase
VKNRRHISRRAFLRHAAAGASLGVAGVALSRVAGGEEPAEPSASKLPRWYGFNLQEKFMMPQNNRFPESDFAWIAELGFNFARLPMDYRCWTDPNDWTRLREEVLKEIDEAIAFGEKHHIHVMLNFHRAPGYTVAQPAEAKDLWKNEEAQTVCAMHWGRFAERYTGVPNRRLSFNLFNEPAFVAPDAYRRVVERMLDAIRKHDDKRLVVCDGRMWGRTPPEELLGLGVAAATRGYDPHMVTHYKAEWVGGSDKWNLPAYPLRDGDVVWNKDRLRQRCIDPWKQLEAKGMGVMVGEFGAYNKTPHPVVLAWMRDFLDLWKEAGWGWALWCFRGSFGILDSVRADVTYEDWRGHKLDRAMLELLRSSI